MLNRGSCAGCGCGFLSVLLLAIAGFVGYQLFFAVPSKPMEIAARAAAASTPAPTAAAQFDAKVATAVAKAKTLGPRQPVRIVLTEAELSAKAAQASSSTPGSETVRDVAVKIREGSMLLTGRASVAGREMPVEAEVKLSAVEGKLSVDITSVKAGGLPIPVPGPIKDVLLQQIGRAMGDDSLQAIDLGIDVKSVWLTNGQLEIEGLTR